MNVLKLKYFVKKYIWLLLPFSLIILFLILIITNTSQQITDKQPDNRFSPTPIIPTSVPVQEENVTEEEGEIKEFHPETWKSGLFNTEKLRDDTMRYSYTSIRSARPDITIADMENNILFERIIAEPEYQFPVSDFLNDFGQPERLITGSNYYGPEAKIYIYANHGTAIIVDPKTQLVIEYHRFQSMNTGEYLQKYGEYILNK